MLKANYEHPPRKLDFYIKLITFFLAFWSSILIVAITWYMVIHPIFNLILMIISTCLWFLFYKPYMDLFLIRYDGNIDKTIDITEQKTPPPFALEAVVIMAYSLGFETVAVQHDYQGLSKTPKTHWLMKNIDGSIWLRFIEMEGEFPYLAEFLTSFGNGFVMTAYPFYDTETTKDYIIDAVNTSFEASYSVHIRNLSKFEREAKKPIFMKSSEEFYHVYKNVNNSSKAVNNNAANRTNFLLFTIGLASASITYLIGGLVSVFQLKTPLLIPPALLSIIYLAIFFYMTKNALPKGRDVSQAKKSE